MQITGKIIHVSPLQGGTSAKGNQWQRQEYVIETQGQYKKRCCFSLMNDKINSSNIQVGEELTVDFDIDAREYNGRWYNSINAWKVTRPGQTLGDSIKHTENGNGQPAPQIYPSHPSMFEPQHARQDDDGMPF